MKRLLASLALIAAAAALSGCYYDPGYSYVRTSGYGGDAYYGQGSSAYYVTPGYYDNYYYGSGYYGCCYAPGVSIGINSGWYGSPRYRGGYRSGHAYRGHGYQGHGYQGHGGSHRGGGSRGGGSHGGSHDGRGGHGHHR